MPQMKVRFAVGTPLGSRSRAWKLWVENDEVYLLQRHMGRQHKFSFHKSGNCRWALIEELIGSDRALVKWKRAPIPQRGLLQGSLLISLIFPTNHLSSWYEERSVAVRWIAPAPAGQALAVDLSLTHESQGAVEEELSKTESTTLLAYGGLKSGLNVLASIYTIECGPVELTVPRSPIVKGQVFGELRFPNVDTDNTGRPVRMLMISEHQSDKPPIIWELGGYEAKKL